MNGARPLLVSTDADLIDDVLRLAAANGVEVHLATDAEGARSQWQLAPLVIVGADAAASTAGAAMGRRRDVILVSQSPSADDWQCAVALGAEHVVSLPEGERWLIDRLADSGEGVPRDGAVIVVVGSGGGAGASTFAATLALAAASRSLRVLLVDGDPSGGGLDVLLGIEDGPGIRWQDLVEARGRLGAAAFDQALPHAGGVSVLSWGRDEGAAVPVEVLAAVVDTGVRGYDLVVADMPRHLDASTELLLSRADQVLVVGTNHVRSTAATARLAAEYRTRCTQLGAILRLDRRGVNDDAVRAALTSVPVVASIPWSGPAAVRADEGEQPSLKDSYGRACLSVLRTLAPSIGRIPDDTLAPLRSLTGRGRRSA
jgi:secretion/DNA translocation related CpaE-like protein